MPDMTKISVVIASFNDVRILETIKSIDEQNYPRDSIEIVVQDAGSSPDIIQKIKGALSEQDSFYCEEDKGIFDGINRGLKKVTGALILSLGTDDKIADSDLFSKVKALYDEGANFIMCGLCYTDKTWSVIRKWPARKLSYANYLMGRQYAHLSLFCTPRILSELGYFNSENPVNADYEFFLQAIKNIKKIDIRNMNIDDYSVYMRTGGNSSKSLTRVFLANIRMLKFVAREDPLLMIGFLLKPVHKLLEFVRAKVSEIK